MSKQDRYRKEQAHEVLSSRTDLNPTEIVREHRPELMVPKLALIGIFNTLENFCVAGKNSIMNSIGSVHVRNLSLFLGALRGSINLAEKILSEYQTIQESLVAEEQAGSPFVNQDKNLGDPRDEDTAAGPDPTEDGSLRENVAGESETPTSPTPPIDPKKLN